MSPYSIRELGPRTWDDFARLVRKHDGIWGGCWCIAFHLKRSSDRTAAQNRAEKESLVRSGQAHAALVYDGDDILGWCQFGSPGELPGRMSAYARTGAKAPDWRITCFFVDRGHRGEGVATAALDGALHLIAAKGGGTVDGYPTDHTRSHPSSNSFLWAGTTSMFAEAGFLPLTSLGPRKVVMRRLVSRR